MAPAHPRAINYLLTTLKASRPQVRIAKESLSTGAVDNLAQSVMSVENLADSSGDFGLPPAVARAIYGALCGVRKLHFPLGRQDSRAPHEPKDCIGISATSVLNPAA